MNTLPALAFKPVTLADKDVIEGYMSKWGEGSCQHSFVSMYLLSHKYGDSFCVRDGYLFVLRAGLCRAGERAYLFPMGDTADEAALRAALTAVLQDAHAHGAAARFETLTARQTALARRLLPGRFAATADRDLAEYLYTCQKLAELPGAQMQHRRKAVNVFFRRYAGRIRIERIGEEHLDDIRAFQAFWSASGQSREDAAHLAVENAAIEKGLAHFRELGLSGIVVYVDGRCAGYAYGAPLSDTCYDAIAEKGDRRFIDIYQVLNRESVRRCCEGYAWINREEDLGMEGLRTAKMNYKPDILLEKYIVREAGA